MLLYILYCKSSRDKQCIKGRNCSGGIEINYIVFLKLQGRQELTAGTE